MKTLDELAGYIRYQLSELGAHNAHHEFEHLARQYARLRISERIIPATGPVSAGGDAGRDFESYRSYLASTPIAGSTFLACPTNTGLVFGCSLDKKIEPKIRHDLKIMFSTPGPIDAVYYFCEADVPIGKRNKLKTFCKEKYGVELTIFDGQALAENLTDIDVFWIAQKFLSVPAEMYPKAMTSDDAYEKRRRHWIVEGHQPMSFADFMAVKAGIRRATFSKEHRADIISWLKVMEAVRNGQNTEFLRKATYEICVASLRGLNDLFTHRNLVIEYFRDIGELEDIADLRDAATLLSYCSSAVVQGHFDLEGTTLHEYSITLIQALDRELNRTRSPGRLCELLQTRGTVEALQFRIGPTPQLDPQGMFSFWKKMLRHVPNAPLFPLEQFADILTILAPHFADDKRFEAITQRTDELLGKRTSGYVAAEKCRDRAAALLKEDKVLQAIRQLHVAKIKCFSAETLDGSILSMLVLSQCYRDLGLIYAASDDPRHP